MATPGRKPKLVAVVGPTASGKSALAMKIAQNFNGEIIAADSRTVYKGMDIGTAKPTKVEQARVPHHLLNIIEPDQNFSVAEFKKRAEQAIKSIHDKGKLAILVGGSGLYIDAVLFDFQFDPGAERDPQNPRHQLEKGKQDFTKLITDTVVLGLAIDNEKLKLLVKSRVKAMASNGFVEEVKKLAKVYSLDSEVFKTPGYLPFYEYIKGNIDLETAERLFAQGDLKLVKKQRTWFKRNQHIHWFSDSHPAYDFVAKRLNK